MKKIAGTNWIKGSLAGLVALFLLVVVCGCGNNPTGNVEQNVVDILIWGNEPDDLSLLRIDFWSGIDEYSTLVYSVSDSSATLPYHYAITLDNVHHCNIGIYGSSTPHEEIQYVFCVNGEELTPINFGGCELPEGGELIWMDFTW